jgi:hypothetical protein
MSNVHYAVICNTHIPEIDNSSPLHVQCSNWFADPADAQFIAEDFEARFPEALVVLVTRTGTEVTWTILQGS